ncbi:unnamed protein product [Malus baccata var. baccata]
MFTAITNRRDTFTLYINSVSFHFSHHYHPSQLLISHHLGFLFPKLCLFIFSFIFRVTMESNPLLIPPTGLSSFLSLELFICLFLFVFVFGFWLSPGGLAWALSKFKGQIHSKTTIPGPSGLPLLGLVLSFTGSLTHRVLAKLAETSKAKPLMAFSVGFTRFVISSHPDTAKELLNSSAFADRPIKESAYELLFHKAMGFAPFGEYWRNLRRISSTHLFHPQRIASFGLFRESIGRKMVGEMKSFMKRSDEVEVRKVLHFGSLNSVMMSVFGRSYEFGGELGCGNGEGLELEGLVSEGYELLGIFNWSDHFPFLGFLDLQGVRSRCKKLVAKVNAFVGKIIEEHRVKRDENYGVLSADHESGDFVDVLLDLEKENKLSDSDMIAVLWWLISNPNFEHSDETLSYFVDYFGRRKDFKATHDVIVSSGGVAGAKTFASAIDRLVRAGRPAQAVSFFEKMEKDYGLKRDKDSLKLVIEKLCENGFASNAEKMVKGLANEFFPDVYMCDLLIQGWCVDGKLEEARRLAGEMYRGGFEIGTTAYNAILHCVSKLCRKKDPFRLHSEVEEILVDMDTHGVPRNAETFNVMISNFCKIRRTEDALNLFERMGEWGCYPNDTTFLVLIRSLYQAARIGEGDEMIDKMKSAGFGEALNKEYFGFLKILCGIERIDHALRVFKKMKDDKFEPGIKTYELATALINEAQKRGVPLTQKAYPELKAAKKGVKEKKRVTFPDKIARKKRRLKQIRLSFVKKPKKMQRRAY